MSTYNEALLYKRKQADSCQEQKQVISDNRKPIKDIDNGNVSKRQRTEPSRGGMGDTISITRLATGHLDKERKMLSLFWKSINVSNSYKMVLNAYLSFMYAMMPKQQVKLEEIIKDSGYDISFIEYPTDKATWKSTYASEERGEVMLPGPCENIVLLCFCFMLLFKNITPHNLNDYSKKRIAAMCSIIGANKDMIGLPFTFEKIKYIKDQINGLNGFKKMIADFITSDEARNKLVLRMVIAYVKNMLEWSGMTAYATIKKWLIDHSSPILSHPAIAAETVNVMAATEELSKCDHPPFYRYLGPRDKQKMFEHNRFPTLFMVSQYFAANKQPSMTELAGVGNVDPALVLELLDMHRNSMMSLIANRMRDIVPAIQYKMRHW